MKIAVVKPVNRAAANAADLAADYKHRGYQRHYAWDMFVKERGLRPEMNAGDFYALFESVTPCAIDRLVQVDFQATHTDTAFDMPCNIIDDEHCHRIIWANGATGSNPLSDPTFFTRFVPIEGDNHA